MRKAFLVVVLVAASFAGGAVVNGPGLSWAKTAISGRMHEPDAIPTLDVSHPVPPPIVPPASSDFSAAPPPLLGVAIPKTPAPHPTRTDEPAPMELEIPLLDRSPAPPLSDPPPETAAQPQVAQSTTPPLPARVDPTVTPVSDPAPTTPAASSSTTWDAIQSRMKGFGVTRYQIEGAPGGPCLFRCTVPMAGSESVSQQFEAEGDDASRAAEAALRRIALWKATEKE